MEGGEMQGAAQRMLPWPITPKCPWSRGSPKAPAPPWVVLPVCQGAAISFVQHSSFLQLPWALSSVCPQGPCCWVAPLAFHSHGTPMVFPWLHQLLEGLAGLESHGLQSLCLAGAARAAGPGSSSGSAAALTCNWHRGVAKCSSEGCWLISLFSKTAAVI